MTRRVPRRRAETEGIEAFSDAWFALLDRHPGTGPLPAAAADDDLVLCTAEKVYRLDRLKR